MVVFRFKFADNISYIIRKFAYENKNNARYLIKNNWEIFCKENSNEFEAEFKRLVDIGYSNDYDEMITKMYNSVRYYYMKNKKIANKLCEEFGIKKKKVTFAIDNDKGLSPLPKRKNIHFEKSVINTMTSHIIEYMKEHKNYTPKQFFSNFIEEHNNLYTNEENKFITNHNYTTQKFIVKFKKTYKNLYYKINKQQ